MPRAWTEEGRDERFQCEHCEVSFAQNSGFRSGWGRLRGRTIAKHYRRKHLWGNFYCNLCDFFAYYPGHYASHMLETHTDMDGGVAALCTECNTEVHLKENPDTLAEHYKECVESWDAIVREMKKKHSQNIS